MHETRPKHPNISSIDPGCCTSRSISWKKMKMEQVAARGNRRLGAQGLAATLAFMVAVTIGSSGAEAGEADTSFVYAKCSAKPIPSGSAFWGNLGTTLHQLVENTAYADFYFKTQNGGANCPAFGEATCNKTLAPEDCTDCLAQIFTHIWSICNDAIGGEVKVVDCCLRYEQYRF